MATTEAELPQVPDNDDPTAAQAQPDVLAQAEAVLANQEAKISDLGDARALFQQWVAEVRGRQAVVAQVDADSDGPSKEAEGNHETQLEGPQVEWVRKGIEARYERSRLVSGPLLETEGVPAFPSMEAVLKSALKQLTREKVAYMMEEGRPAFSFQMKLVTPSKQVKLQKTLVNGQPKRMDTPDQKQQDLYVWDKAEAHLASRPSQEKMEWKWEFIQADQLIEEPQKGDDASLRLEDRVKSMKRSRPEGMRGMDRHSWAALMADSLEQGKPLDIRFKGNAMNTPEYEKWLFTVLDEEGELTEGGNRYLVGGFFNPDTRRACLAGYNADRRSDDARFRSSVDGSIEA